MQILQLHWKYNMSHHLYEQHPSWEHNLSSKDFTARFLSRVKKKQNLEFQKNFTAMLLLLQLQHTSHVAWAILRQLSIVADSPRHAHHTLQQFN